MAMITRDLPACGPNSCDGSLRPTIRDAGDSRDEGHTVLFSVGSMHTRATIATAIMQAWLSFSNLDIGV